MRAKTLLLVLPAVLAVLLASCGGAVGDPCKTNDDCFGILTCYGGACNAVPGEDAGPHAPRP